VTAFLLSLGLRKGIRAITTLAHWQPEPINPPLFRSPFRENLAQHLF
jgi:hypothetical protein